MRKERSDSWPEGTIRIYNCCGVERRRIKANGKMVLYHRWLWEQANGKVPEGYQVHHIDFDKLNDSLDNLQLLTRAEHIKIHMEARRNEGVPVWNKGIKTGLPAWNRGIPQSEEAKAKSVASHKGQKGWNKGMKTGKPAWNRGMKASAETRAKSSKSHLGYVVSAETRAKLAASGKKAWLTRRKKLCST